MTNIELRIGEISVESQRERGTADQIPELLREAFELLAQRLQDGAVERWGTSGSVVIEQLEVSPLAADELLGPAGAEKLAEELFRQLVEARR